MFAGTSTADCHMVITCFSEKNKTQQILIEKVSYCVHVAVIKRVVYFVVRDLKFVKVDLPLIKFISSLFKEIKVHAFFCCFCGNIWSSRNAWYLISLKNCSLLKQWLQKCQYCCHELMPRTSKKSSLRDAITCAVEW